MRYLLKQILTNKVRDEIHPQKQTQLKAGIKHGHLLANYYIKYHKLTRRGEPSSFLPSRLFQTEQIAVSTRQVNFFSFTLEGRHICHSVPTDINPDLGVQPCFGKWSISFNEVASVNYYVPCSLLMAICGFVKFAGDEGSILVWPHQAFRD